MSAKGQNDAKRRADEDFAARRRDITQLRGFRRTDSFFNVQPRAFNDFNLWQNPTVLDEIIVGCSRLEIGEHHEAFPSLLSGLIHEIEYMHPRVTLGRFEILEVYNHLVDNPHKTRNPFNRWKAICIDFVNEIARPSRNRYFSSSSFKYEDYVKVYKRLVNAWVELKFGEGSYTQYIDCVKLSVHERARGVEPHRDHPGFCMREKPKPDASQAAHPAPPASREKQERGQSQSRRGSNTRTPEQDRTAYDPRQDLRSRPPAAPMEERVAHDRGPDDGMRERMNPYARHEPSFGPQHSEHGDFEYGPRQDIPYRPHPAPREGRVGRDRVPAGGMGGRVHPYPEREPSFAPQSYPREPVDNRAFRQRRATSGEADWRESDVRDLRNRMARW